MKVNWKRLYARMEDAWKDVSWRKAAKELDVTPSVFTRLSKGKSISVKNLLKLLRREAPPYSDLWYYVDEKSKETRR